MSHTVEKESLASRSVGRIAGMRRAVPLTIQSTTGVEPLGDEPGAWNAVDDRPQFELGSFSAFAGRWIRFSVDIRPKAAWSSSPVLLVDCGAGYFEQNAVVLPRPALGETCVDHVLYVPHGAIRARLDPLARSGPFHLGTPHVQCLTKPMAAWLMVRELRRRQGRRKLVVDAFRGLTPLPTPARLRAHMRELASQYQQSRLKEASDYPAWIATFEPDAGSYASLAAQQQAWQEKPLISIVMPVYNTPIGVLREALESVQAQIYPNWELCIADDASPDPQVKPLLQEFARSDERIKLVHRESNGHIVAASNSALDLATGDFVALMDHDDLLHPLALHYVAEVIERHPAVGLIFTDEDKIDEYGNRFDPYFKCDFNYELMLAHNMVSHLGVYRRALVQELAGFRKGCEGSQDYDLALRAIEKLKPQQIAHIPRVLYHWRAIVGSTARAAEEKPYAVRVARKVIAEHLERLGRRAEVTAAPEAPNMNRVRFAIPEPAPLVSIVIPTRDRADLLSMCIDSILKRSTYPNFEVIVVDNGSVEEATMTLFARLPADRVRVLRDESPFNFSALNNHAVRTARGALVCLMNNDIEIITPDWLEEMVSFAQHSEVGCVGARLWYPDGRLQHGGVITGLGGIAGHAHKLLTRGSAGYFGRAVLHQSFSAVTAACLVVRTEVFEQVEGLDEALQVAFNDVDFCLRVRQAGYRNVWTPYAEMVHHESASRGQETTPEKQKRFEGEVHYMEERWADELQVDPAYSPNLTLTSDDFGIAWPSRVVANVQ